MNTLIAFDKYKGALDARSACELAREALSVKLPKAKIHSAPLTDGGEGFASILAEALGGELRTVAVPGPLFEPVDAHFALVEAESLPKSAWQRLNLPDELINGKIGIVEMASASGFECLSDDQRNPWQTTTYGTGLLMKEAIRAGAEALILGIGGSATNDCGAGALEALGVCYYDRELQPVTKVVPGTFRQINTLGSTSHLLDKFPPVRIACDVTNPLLGENGATRVFGPQKGLLPEDADRMERTIQKMGRRVLGLFGKHPTDWDKLMTEPGSGAAGGIGFALRHALPDSEFVEGFPLVADLLDLPHKVKESGLIISGEGRLDQSSLAGKGPVALLRLAGPAQKVVLLVGSADATTVKQLASAHPNLETLVLSDPDWPIEKALSETPASLRNALEKVALPG
ncbi:glycerate kinase [Puniceicoccales bacterium CK1056]|uniref:Glycerate kinase n=1 Tax=Oceanipulchritudo coccoides TaxID=2706888 RepID=A0A6B2M0D1_9BACT|nr:glycerate kinase [Oceanipulchritudo coccoides]NDV61215.1 glycerate kinase [Oceanipulchritudo coccoides]